MRHVDPDPAAKQLALFGGRPQFPQGPPPWPPVDERVWQALEAAYRDGSWGRYHGPNCRSLAAELQEYFHREFALLACSGTIAVELALRAVDVREGDEVILAAYDFPGNFRAIEAIAARPVLIDIVPSSWCLDADQLPSAISSTTKAILVSHLHGGLAPMRRIMQLAAERQIAVVEDACQAPGAVVDGQKVGTWGDVAVLSFGGSKLLTAGRGGAILTSRAELHQRAKIFQERGNDAFPLSELQAAVVRPQLAVLDDHNRRRAATARHLIQCSADRPGLRPVRLPSAGDQAAYYKVAWALDRQQGGWERAHFIQAAQAEGLALDAGFRGFTRRSARRCRRVGSLLHSHDAAEQTVLLHHPILLEGEEAVCAVAAAIEKIERGLPCSAPPAASAE